MTGGNGVTPVRPAVSPQAGGGIGADWPFRLAILLLLACALAQCWVVSISTGAGGRWVVDVVDGGQLFGTDDYYRYFMARALWRQPGIFSWSYDLPVGLLLDHALVVIAHGSLLWARWLKVVVEFFSLFLTWRAGLALGADRRVLAYSLLLLAVMPLYAGVFVSFLGEGWLTLVLCAGTLALIRERYGWAALAVSLLPLIRPEGVTFMGAFGLFFLVRGRYRCLLILGAPLYVYWAHMLWAPGGIYAYMHWRWIFRQAFNIIHVDYLFHAGRILTTVNPLWTVPAMLFLLLGRLRSLWPLWLGALVLVATHTAMVWMDDAIYEARHFVVILPLLVLAWAVLFSDAMRGGAWRWPASRWALVFAASTALVVGENMLQSDPLRAMSGMGRRWPVDEGRLMASSFQAMDSAGDLALRDAVEKIYAEAATNPRLKIIVVYDIRYFYWLDPQKLPEKVRVVYNPVSFYESIKYYDGSFLIIHPGGEQYDYYTFYDARDADGDLALFAGSLSFDQAACPICRPVFDEQGVRLYEFSYRSSSRPRREPGPGAREDFHIIPR